MSDLPPELLREIFLRLAAESLLRLRRVCKQWARIIDDPFFIKDHTQNQQNPHTLLLTNGSGNTHYFFSLDSLHFTDGPGPQLIDAIHINSAPLPIRSFCNSLILMDNNFGRKELVIWNPLTDERRYFKLPQQINITPRPCRYGFGYDYDADDYKVVIIDEYCQTHVYSLKSDSWRRIQNCPRKIHFRGKTFFNGNLYWPSQDTLTIIALHLGAEIFSEFPLPPVDRSAFDSFTTFQLETLGIDFITNFQLDALDGCLICSLNYTERETIYGWVMKDKSWIKLFSLKYSVHNVSSWRLRVVAYLKRKEQVVLEHTRGFLWFDIETNFVKKFSIHGFQGIGYSRICPGSLVRLNVRGSAVGVGDVATRIISKRKTGRRVTRLKLCVGDVGAMCCLDDYSSYIANKCLVCRFVDEQFWKKLIDN